MIGSLIVAIPKLESFELLLVKPMPAADSSDRLTNRSPICIYDGRLTRRKGRIMPQRMAVLADPGCVCALRDVQVRRAMILSPIIVYDDHASLGNDHMRR